jgi:hypothetical protein
MQGYIIVAIEYLIVLASGIFAYRQGGLPERLGLIWWGVNIVVGVLLTTANLDTPLSHLILDGVFAIGLLPLAMIFVSYWIGAVTLISAALFGLEAVYLLNDRPIDPVYAWVNNSLLLLIPAAFLSSGFVNIYRRSAKATAVRRPKDPL